MQTEWVIMKGHEIKRGTILSLLPKELLFEEKNKKLRDKRMKAH